VRATRGVALEYDFIISHDESNIYASLANVAPSPKTKAFVEGTLGGLGVVNLAADLVSEAGMRQALFSTKSKDSLSGNVTFAPFAAVSYGRQRLMTGSHVDVDGFSGLVGIAAHKNFENLSIMGGGFFEFGNAHHKSYNSTDSGDVNGKGKAHYYGLGLLSRLELTDTVMKGLYLEGSLRYGWLYNDWHTDDMIDFSTGKRAEYDVSHHYYGAHLGIGYIKQAGDSIAFDVYGKLLWSHLNSADTTIADDRYRFDAINSWRGRVGTRVDFTLTSTVGLYAGVAFEHEFLGEGKAKILVSTMSYDLPSPSTRGNSVVIESGVMLNNLLEGLNLGVGVTGYLGKRRGINGSLKVQYVF